MGYVKPDKFGTLLFESELCRKVESSNLAVEDKKLPLALCLNETTEAVKILKKAGLNVSKGDIKVILMGTILSKLAELQEFSKELATLHQLEKELDTLVDEIAL
ncbi:MAG: hypothetical protein WCS37_14315 [Chloroflexota bacterium]|nr:hypothetical protein [Chloroflexota bacterium]